MSLGASVRIVRNLNIMKWLLFLPIRFWQNRMGPALSSFIKMASMASRGARIIIALSDIRMSSSLFIAGYIFITSL